MLQNILPCPAPNLYDKSRESVDYEAIRSIRKERVIWDQLCTVASSRKQISLVSLMCDVDDYQSHRAPGFSLS